MAKTPNNRPPLPFRCPFGCGRDKRTWHLCKGPRGLPVFRKPVFTPNR